MRRTADDDRDEDWDDWDEPQDWEPEPDTPSETISCPYCRREIHEDSVRCPGCGNYLSEEDTPPSRKPWWIILGFVLAFYAAYRLIAVW